MFVLGLGMGKVAQPLRVAKAATGELDLSWQDTGAPLFGLVSRLTG